MNLTLDVLSEYLKTAGANTAREVGDTCQQMLVEPDTWHKFLSFLTSTGATFHDNDNVEISILNSKLKQKVLSAVKKSRYLVDILRQVQVSKQVVTYLLDHFERESLVFSDIDDKNKKCYTVI